jgi:hypothetical protein
MALSNERFDAYQLIGMNDEVEGTVWWDGHQLRASTPGFLEMIRRQVIPFSFEGGAMLQASDGEDFFRCLPLAFRNGFSYLKSIQVDENGRAV